MMAIRTGAKILLFLIFLTFTYVWFFQSFTHESLIRGNARFASRTLDKRQDEAQEPTAAHLTNFPLPVEQATDDDHQISITPIERLKPSARPISTSRSLRSVFNNIPALTGNAPNRTVPPVSSHSPSRSHSNAPTQTSSSSNAAEGNRVIKIIMGVCGAVIFFVLFASGFWIVRRVRRMRQHPEEFEEPPRFPRTTRLRRGERAMPLPTETTYSEQIPPADSTPSRTKHPRMFLPSDPLALKKLSPAEKLKPYDPNRASQASDIPPGEVQKEGPPEIELTTFRKEEVPRADVTDNRLDTVLEDPSMSREEKNTEEVAGPSRSRSLSTNGRSPSRHQGARHSFHRFRTHRFGAPQSDPRPGRSRTRPHLTALNLETSVPPVPQLPDLRLPRPPSSVYTPAMASTAANTRPPSLTLDSRRPSFIPDTRPTSDVPSEFSETLRLAFGEVDPWRLQTPRTPRESGLMPPPLNVRNRLFRSESDPDIGSSSRRVSGTGSDWGEIPMFYARDLGSAVDIREQAPQFDEEETAPEEIVPQEEVGEKEEEEEGEGEEEEGSRKDKGKGRVYETEEGEVIGVEEKKAD